MAPSRHPAPRATPRKIPPLKQDKKPNASILTFFKKADTEQGLFCDSTNTVTKAFSEVVAIPDVNHVDDVDGQFHELETPIKKRKLSRDEENGDYKDEKVFSSNGSRPSRLDNEISPPPSSREYLPTHLNVGQPTAGRMVGGFVVDDDSDEDDIKKSDLIIPLKDVPKAKPFTPLAPKESSSAGLFKQKEREETRQEAPGMDLYPDIPEEGFFEGDDEIPDDFMGEEYREMMFSQQQARLEAEEAGTLTPDDVFQPMPDIGENCCPICGGSLVGTTPDESTLHVNSCLDGKPTPLPSKPSSSVLSISSEPAMTPLSVDEAVGRAAKAAVPRAGQANPFATAAGGATSASSSSAFSKLMAGNAEQSAWAEAAATETASRGKSAYQRTCPFYKIMPGFSICVDAFRYGAVKDCNAYFLSHFHSDHYIGLTPKWKHGPIYCSRVTASLVKQQLRVAADFVVELEFEEKFEIPGTEGASVTMIPANHCPGSSLFLFEKRTGKGPNQRVQRILHCGDFRACYAHVTHDLLKPEIVDNISGKLKRQKIDICYLDTTYLNPRYNFPPQDDVIRACADVCGEIAHDASATERLGRENGTTSVSHFFQKSDAPPQGATNGKEGGGTSNSSRLLVVCGTYSIGKERICLAIAEKLDAKIYAAPAKMRICRQLDDAELGSRLTSDPLEAQVHLQSLGEIRAETLQQYLDGYRPHFGRIVGFRPSGWNYRPRGTFFARSATAATQPAAIPTAQLVGEAARSSFGVADLERQRGSTAQATCFGVPYSEHSSFRELCMFIMALRIDRVVPTVNVGSETSRKRMKGWLDKWQADRGKGGTVLPRLRTEGMDGGADGGTAMRPWDGKGNNRDAWW